MGIKFKEGMDQTRETVAGLQKKAEEAKRQASEAATQTSQVIVEGVAEMRQDPLTFLKHKVADVKTSLPEDLVAEAEVLLDRIQELQSKIVTKGVSTITLEETRTLLLQAVATILTVTPEALKPAKFSVMVSKELEEEGPNQDDVEVGYVTPPCRQPAC